MGPCRAAELMVVKSCSLSASANLKFDLLSDMNLAPPTHPPCIFPQVPTPIGKYT